MAGLTTTATIATGTALDELMVKLMDNEYHEVRYITRPERRQIQVDKVIVHDTEAQRFLLSLLDASAEHGMAGGFFHKGSHSMDDATIICNIKIRQQPSGDLPHAAQ